MTEIRFDQPISLVDSNKIQLDKNKTAPVMDDNITINSSIRSLIDTISAIHDAVPEDARVSEIRNQIQSGQYTVNQDQLAQILTQHIFRKSI